MTFTSLFLIDRHNILTMQKLPKGIFTNSTAAVLPLASFAHRHGFDSTLIALSLEGWSYWYKANR